MPAVTEIPHGHNPFPMTGVSRDSGGVRHYDKFSGDKLPATLLDMLAEQVDRRPDTEAVVELGADRLTYRQLWDRAARVAGGLLAGGLMPGDRVAVRYPAGINWVLAFWGTVMAGGVAVAVNTRSAQPEVDFVLADSGALVDLAADTPLPDGQPHVSEQLGRTDIAALFYTSGTTGHPKGVPTTHEAFLTNTENARLCLGLSPDVRPAHPHLGAVVSRDWLQYTAFGRRSAWRHIGDHALAQPRRADRHAANRAHLADGDRSGGVCAVVTAQDVSRC